MYVNNVNHFIFNCNVLDLVVNSHLELALNCMLNIVDAILMSQDGVADGSLHGVVRSCFYVFVSLSCL